MFNLLGFTHVFDMGISLFLWYLLWHCLCTPKFYPKYFYPEYSKYFFSVHTRRVEIGHILCRRSRLYIYTYIHTYKYIYIYTYIYIYIWCWGQLKLTTCGRPGQVSRAKLRTLEPSMVRVWVHRGDIAALNSGLVSTAYLKSHEFGLKVANEYGSIWLVRKHVERRWKKLISPV